VTIQRRPKGCKMVHRGKCYGNCPRGYRPTFLKGWFRPVCTSVCAHTNHPYTCGVGCANSRSNCAKIILRQVGEVAAAASRVASFFIGKSVFTETVVYVKRVGEFALNVIKKISRIAEGVFKQLKREKAELVLVLAIFQIIKEEVKKIGHGLGAV